MSRAKARTVLEPSIYLRTPKLQPCPFCGEERHIRIGERLNDYYEVHCLSCGARTRAVLRGATRFLPKEEPKMGWEKAYEVICKQIAAYCWNNRAQEFKPDVYYVRDLPIMLKPELIELVESLVRNPSYVELYKRWIGDGRLFHYHNIYVTEDRPSYIISSYGGLELTRAEAEILYLPLTLHGGRLAFLFSQLALIVEEVQATQAREE